MITTEPDERLVFTPHLGFRSAQLLESPANLVIERDGLTLTANLVCDRDCTTLHFTVLGFDPPADFDAVPYYHVKASATVRDGHGRTVAPHPRWHTGGMVHRRSDGSLILDWQLKLVRLEPDVRSVEIEADVVDEPGIEPNSRVRYLQGIGANHQRGLANELLMLRDDQGHHHLERAVMSQPGPRQRQVAPFRVSRTTCIPGRSKFRSSSCSNAPKKGPLFRSRARPSCDSWGAKRRSRHRAPAATRRRFARVDPTIAARVSASRSSRKTLKRQSSSCTSRDLKSMAHQM